MVQSAFKAQAIRKHEEWNLMVKAFEEHPHMATDALALGYDFKSLKTVPVDKVWEWK